MRSTLHLITTLAPIFALSAAADAQCTTTTQTSLVDGYRAIKVSAPGQPAPAGAAWSFWMESFGNSPLVGYYPNGVNAPGFFGRPDLAFGVPTAGPVFSPNSQINENSFYDRLPSFTGIMMHPGASSSQDSIAVFSPQRTVLLSALQVQAEVVGNLSNGIFVTAELTLNNTTSTLISPTFVPYTNSGSMTANASIPSEITLNPGDRLTIRVEHNGDYVEDWANIDARLTLRQGPIIIAPPRATRFCQNSTGQLSILASGSPTLSYQWRRAGNNLSNDSKYSGVTTSILSISTIRPEDAGSYDCIVTSPCGIISSSAADLVVCAADFNCDGIVDFFDYLDFVAEFSGNGPNADFNADQVVDFFDYLDFVAAFSVGC